MIHDSSTLFSIWMVVVLLDHHFHLYCKSGRFSYRQEYPSTSEQARRSLEQERKNQWKSHFLTDARKNTILSLTVQSSNKMQWEKTFRKKKLLVNFDYSTVRRSSTAVKRIRQLATSSATPTFPSTGKCGNTWAYFGKIPPSTTIDKRGLGEWKVRVACKSNVSACV